MHRLGAMLMLGAVLLMAAVSCQAQSVHWMGVGSAFRSNDTADWTVGGGSARFGLSEYYQMQDAVGNRLNTLSDFFTKASACQEFTVMHFGPYSREVKAPIRVVAGVFLAALASLVVVACAVRTFVRQVASPKPAL